MKFSKNDGGIVLIIILFIFSIVYKLGLWFLLVGSIMIYYGINYLLFLNYISKKGIEVHGKIMSYESDDGYKIPIIEFQDLEERTVIGKPYYYATSDINLFKNYKNNINKSIIVLYNPEKPERFVIKAEKGFNYTTIVFLLIVSIIFITIAIANLLGYINMSK